MSVGRDMPPEEAFSALLADIRSGLTFMADCGCTGFDSAAPAQAPGIRETLETIRSDLGDCRRCGLSRTRNRIVFGAGSPGARLVFVGEGPGYEEDRSGVPFVGRAGQLLDRIIAAMKLTREAVYICNIVKCRPPNNRNPLPEEIESCIPFLERQIAALAPAVICTLGAVATRALLGTDAPISRLRGRFHDYRGTPVMPTYHPAFLLRHPEKKRETWGDIQKIMGLMEKNSLLTSQGKMV